MGEATDLIAESLISSTLITGLLLAIKGISELGSLLALLLEIGLTVGGAIVALQALRKSIRRLGFGTILATLSLVSIFGTVQDLTNLMIIAVALDAIALFVATIGQRIPH